jgi:hypothetical protein
VSGLEIPYRLQTVGKLPSSLPRYSSQSQVFYKGFLRLFIGDAGKPLPARAESQTGRIAVSPCGQPRKVNNMANGKARSAITGRYVKVTYANNHKNTTVVEHRKSCPKK